MCFRSPYAGLSKLTKATEDPGKRETSSAKLTEATTIEVDELDVVN
jgi:hypothetical protein